MKKVKKVSKKVFKFIFEKGGIYPISLLIIFAMFTVISFEKGKILEGISSQILLTERNSQTNPSDFYIDEEMFSMLQSKYHKSIGEVKGVSVAKNDYQIDRNLEENYFSYFSGEDSEGNLDITLKSEKSYQTFSILRNDAGVELYRCIKGEDVFKFLAVSNPIFEYKENNEWIEYELLGIDNIKVVEQTNNYIIVKKDLLLSDGINEYNSYLQLKIGFDGEDYYKKYSFGLGSGRLNRMVWNIEINRDYDIDDIKDDKSQRDKFYRIDDIELNWMDFEEDVETIINDNEINMVFYSEGKQGNLEIDPSLSLTTSSSEIQVDVENKYRMIMELGVTTDYIEFYDRSENDSSPDQVLEFFTVSANTSSTWYDLQYDENRKITVIENTDSKIKIRVEGYLSTSGGTYLTDGTDKIWAKEEYTFNLKGLFVQTEVDFKGGIWINYIHPVQANFNIVSPAPHSTTIIYGDGITESSTSTTDAVYDDTNDIYTVFQGTGNYQDIMVGELVQNGDRLLDESIDGSWYYGNYPDIYYADGGQTYYRKNTGYWFVLFDSQESLDTESEREAVFNDFMFPDKLDFTTGSEWNDISGNVVNDEPVSPSPGMYFDGSTDYIDIDTAANDVGTSGTVEMWVKPMRNSKAHQFFLSFREGASGDKIYVKNEAGNFQVGFGDVHNYDTGYYFVEDEWVHLAVTWSGTNIKTYVDGNFQSIHEEPDSLSSMTLGCIAGLANAKTDTTYHLVGQIDEIRLWDDERTQQEIQDNMNSEIASSEANLIGYWKLDENEGTVAYDETINNNYGTIYNGKWRLGFMPDHYSEADNNYTISSSSNEIEIDIDGGYGVEFDGGDDYIRAPNDSSLQFGEGSFTVEAWIYPKEPDESTARIINNRGTGTGGSYAGWQLKIGDTGNCDTGKWCFYDSSIDDANSNYKSCDACGSNYDLEEWHHVAMVYESDSEIRYYVNGNLDSTVSVGSYGSISNSLPTALGAGISSNGVEGSRSQEFKGLIDEVRLWDDVRTATEIKQNFKKILEGDEANLVAYWRLDDGSGTSAADSSNNTNTGTLNNSPTWESGYWSVRHDPVFKIRGYRGNSNPAAVSLESNLLIENTDYNFDFKPFTDAYFADELLWYSTMDSAWEVKNPDVGDFYDSAWDDVDFVDGMYGKGANYDADGESISFETANNFNKAKGAIEFWYKPNYDHTDANYYYFWCNHVDANNQFMFRHENGGALQFFAKADGTYSNCSIGQSYYSWIAGEWTHLRVEWDDTLSDDDQFKIYQNGKRLPTGDNNVDYNSANLTLDDYTYIGNYSSSASWDANGIIDEFMVFGGASNEPDDLAQGGDTGDSDEYLFDNSNDYTLDFDAIDSDNRGEYFYIGSDLRFEGLNIDLDTNGSGSSPDINWQYWGRKVEHKDEEFIFADDANLQGLWYFEEAGDATRLDETDNDNDLTETSGDTIAQSSYSKEGDYSADFEAGDTEYLSISDANQTGLDISGADCEMTISLWLKVENISGHMFMVSKYDASTNNRAYQFRIDTTGALKAVISQDGSSYDQITGGTILTQGTWYHGAVVYDDTDIRLYLNGESDATPVAHTSGIHDNSSDFVVGAYETGNYYYDGLIDEVAVFDRDLSADEIYEIYDARKDTYGWGDLSITETDSGASTFESDGNFYFSVPTDWSKYSIKGGTDLFYIRGYLNSGSFSTDPVENIIKTDIIYFQYLDDISSDHQTFRLIQNGAPSVPTLANRLFDNEATSDTTPDLNFESTDGDGDDIEYNLQLDNNEDFSSTVEDVSSDTDSGFENTENGSDTHPFTQDQNIKYTIQTTLSNNTTYFWRVRAKDPNGTNVWSNWSSSRSFTIDSTVTDGEAWLQTADEQFSDDALDHVEVDTGNDRVKLEIDSWWDTDWTKRKKLVFDNADQSSNLQNFPVLVKLDSDRIDYSSVQDDYDDLRFIDSNDSTELDYEVEVWNESGNSYVWVEVPQINSSSTTDYIYMYYGNSSTSTAGEDVSGTWSNSYAGVWHLNETTGSYADSSGNSNDSTTVSVTSRSNNGLIGPNAPDFDGTDDYITIDDDNTLDLGTYTIEAWMNADDVDAWRSVTAKGVSGTFNWYFVFYAKDLFNRNGYSTSGQARSSTNFDEDGSWNYLTTITDEGDSEIRLYKNGSEVDYDHQTWGGNSDNNSNDMQIGKNDSWGEYFDGQLDEIRISSTERSDDWLAAQYDSMNDGFITFNDENEKDGTILSEEMDFTWVSGASSWSKFYWSSDEANGNIKMYVYYDNVGTPTIIPDVDLTGNSSGFETSPVEIDELNTTTYSKLYLYGELILDGGTPYLNDWKITIDENSAPVVSSVSVNSGSDISLQDNTTVSISWTGTVTDANGYDDISSVNGKLYRSGVSGSEDCTNNNNNCYEDTDCALSGCSDNSCTATCTIDMQFHTDPTDEGTYSAEYWRGWIEATDSYAETGEAFSSGGIPDVESFMALDISEESVNYETLYAGEDSGTDNETTTIMNTGNKVIDVELNGDDCCTDYPTCSGYILDVENQEYSTSGFEYGSGIDLTDTAVTVDLSLIKPTTAPSNSIGYVYWGIGIPSLQGVGNYIGKIYFVAVNDN